MFITLPGLMMSKFFWPIRCVALASVLASIVVLPAAIRAADVPDELQQRQIQLTAALKEIGEAVVGVSDGMGVGSGVIVSSDGIVLTASHVVTTRGRRSKNEQAIITMADGRQFKATVLGKDRDADAALLRINDSPPDKSGFPFAEMGSTTESKVGDYCFAMGHPGGHRIERAAPVRVGRILSIGNRTVVSDCAILLGDSGGPLFDMNGRVIGIHSMITSLIIENRHVAIDSFRHDWDRLLAGDRWGRLRSTDNDLAASGFFGVQLKWKDFVPEVTRVFPNTPAEKAGLKKGDVLLTVAHGRIADRLDLSTTLDLLEEEQTVEIGILRDGKESTVALVTGDDAAEIESDDEEDEPLQRPGRAGDADHDREQEILNQLSENRSIGTHEKRAATELTLYEPVVASNKNSVVSIRDGGLLMCLGTVMSVDGYILTKASELHGAIDPEVIFPNGRRFKAQELATDYAFDLMLLKVEARDLQPVSLDARHPAEVGELAVLQNGKGEPLMPTVISVKMHTMEGANKAFMGIRMAEDSNGVRILHVLSGGAAQRNGLKEDDVIMSLEGKAVDHPATLAAAIGAFKPGDKISVRFMRQDKIRTIDIVLTSKFVNEDVMLPLYRDDQFEGQFASTHAGGFPKAIQIDADVYPRQVGGPLLGLNGKALGIVIARADRFPAFAIPADAVATVFEQLKIEAKNRTNP
ncbi:MAG TPA: trypsin-like peptidase domain-containing protein [Planctomycetaceae bacterium]|nr:trypsin-like peptidase domain-containing protein [Planctomycetaceae bacterium]